MKNGKGKNPGQDSSRENRNYEDRSRGESVPKIGGKHSKGDSRSRTSMGGFKGSNRGGQH